MIQVEEALEMEIIVLQKRFLVDFALEENGTTVRFQRYGSRFGAR